MPDPEETQAGTAVADAEPTPDTPAAGIAEGDADASPEPEVESETKPPEAEGESQSGEPEATSEGATDVWKDFSTEDRRAILGDLLQQEEVAKDSPQFQEELRKARQSGEDTAADQYKKTQAQTQQVSEAHQAAIDGTRLLEGHLDALDTQLPKLSRAISETDEEGAQAAYKAIDAIFKDGGFEDGIKQFGALSRMEGEQVGVKQLAAYLAPHRELLASTTAEQRAPLKAAQGQIAQYLALFDIVMTAKAEAAREEGRQEERGNKENQKKVLDSMGKLAALKTPPKLGNGAATSSGTDQDRIDRMADGQPQDGDQEWWNKKYGRS